MQTRLKAIKKSREDETKMEFGTHQEQRKSCERGDGTKIQSNRWNNRQRYQFGFRKGKSTRDAIGLMRIISERVLDVNEEMCLCFIDWQKAFDRVDWTKLLEMLRNIGVNWRER